MPLRHLFMLTAFAGLVNCGSIPQVGGTAADAARAADYPELVALDSLINAAETTAPRITPASVDTTNDRIATRRNRANALRGPVVDPATRSRMRAAIARAALR
jgi:hypothetical protein